MSKDFSPSEWGGCGMWACSKGSLYPGRLGIRDICNPQRVILSGLLPSARCHYIKVSQLSKIKSAVRKLLVHAAVLTFQTENNTGELKYIPSTQII